MLSSPTTHPSDISSSLEKKHWDISNYVYWSLISLTLGLFVLEFFLVKEYYQTTLFYKAGLLLVGFGGYGLLRRKISSPSLMILVMSSLFLAYCFFMVYQSSGYLITLYFLIATLVVGGINYLVVWKGAFSLSLVLFAAGIFLGISYAFDWEGFYALFPLGGYLFFFTLVLTSFIPDSRKKNYVLNLERDLKKEQILKNQAKDLQDLQIKYAEVLEFKKIENQKEKILRHDLKNKVNNIIGLSQIILETNDPEENQSYIQLLNEVSNDLLRFSDNIFSRDEDQPTALRISKSQVNVLSSFKKIKSELEPKLDQSTLELKWLGEENPLLVHVDKLIFNNILVNLLNYLILWSKPDSLILVSGEQSAAQIRIQLSAPSAKISARELNYIFKPLDSFQFTSSFSAPQGLGLQIAKSMTEQMGGYFKYQTGIEDGVIFKLEFEHAERSKSNEA
ncbi:HAMP domain-containing sensor histidine kinase [Algoriphagus confluentis]